MLDNMLFDYVEQFNKKCYNWLIIFLCFLFKKAVDEFFINL